MSIHFRWPNRNQSQENPHAVFPSTEVLSSFHSGMCKILHQPSRLSVGKLGEHLARRVMHPFNFYPYITVKRWQDTDITVGIIAFSAFALITMAPKKDRTAHLRDGGSSRGGGKATAIGRMPREVEGAENSNPKKKAAGADLVELARTYEFVRGTRDNLHS